LSFDGYLLGRFDEKDWYRGTVMHVIRAQVTGPTTQPTHALTY